MSGPLLLYTLYASIKDSRYSKIRTSSGGEGEGLHGQNKTMHCNVVLANAMQIFLNGTSRIMHRSSQWLMFDSLCINMETKIKITKRGEGNFLASILLFSLTFLFSLKNVVKPSHQLKLAEMNYTRLVETWPDIWVFLS